MYLTHFFIIRKIDFFQEFLDFIHKLFLFQQEKLKVQNIVTLCCPFLGDRGG